MAALIRRVTDTGSRDELIALAKQDPMELASHAAVFVQTFGDDRGANTALSAAIAEMAKVPESRPVLGAAGVLPKLVAALALAGTEAGWDAEACTQCFRSIGNLCFDNDENRERVLEAGGVEAIATALRTLNSRADPAREDPCLLHYTAAGIVLNVAMSHEAIQTKMTELRIPAMMATMFCSAAGKPMEIAMALRALSEFATEKETEMLDVLAGGGGARTLVAALHEAAMEAVAPAPTGGDGDEDKQADVNDDEVADLEKGLLREVLKKDARLAAFAHRDVVDMLLEATESKSIKLAGSAAMIIGTILGDDACMELVLAPGLDAVVARLLRWIEVAKTHPTEWDLPAAGAMAIGNLAQSDARATLLVGMPTVIEVLVDLVNSDKSGFQYAAIGTIKNLAICEQNKAVLLTSVNMVPALMLALNSPQGVIQYLAASTIRSLCINQQPDTVKLIAKADGLFSRLAHLGTQEDQAVRYEATRAVANVVRYGQCVPDGVGDCIPQLVVMAAAESPLLVLEALVTLARLAANADLRKQVAETTALDVATEIAGSEGKSAEMVCNAISLIGALHTDADSQYSDAISGLLADLVKSDDATVAAHAAKMAAI